MQSVYPQRTFPVAIFQTKNKFSVSSHATCTKRDGRRPDFRSQYPARSPETPGPLFLVKPVFALLTDCGIYAHLEKIVPFFVYEEMSNGYNDTASSILNLFAYPSFTFSGANPSLCTRIGQKNNADDVRPKVCIIKIFNCHIIPHIKGLLPQRLDTRQPA